MAVRARGQSNTANNLKRYGASKFQWRYAQEVSQTLGIEAIGDMTKCFSGGTRKRSVKPYPFPTN